MTYRHFPILVSLLGLVLVGLSTAHAATDAAPAVTGPNNPFVVLLFCGFMGLLGQGARVAVGLKTMLDYASPANAQSAFNLARLVVSLIIGFLSGVFSALMVWATTTTDITAASYIGDVHTAITFAIAGYIGTDAIEAFTAKYFDTAAQTPGSSNGTKPGNQSADPGQPTPTSDSKADPTAGTALDAKLTDLTERISALDASIRSIPTAIAASTRAAAERPPFDLSSVETRPISPDAQAAITLKEQVLSGSGYNLGALADAGTFERTKIGNNRPTRYSFRRYANAFFAYDPETRMASEVHGKTYDSYRTVGFSGTDGLPNSILGIPNADESEWRSANGTLVGRQQGFTRGTAFHRLRDDQVVLQLMDTQNSRYWGIDGQERFADILLDSDAQHPKRGKLLKTLGVYPCFKGLYLPASPSEATARAAEVHDIFTRSIGLTKVLLADNLGIHNVPRLVGEDAGKSHADLACNRAVALLNAYLKIPEVRQHSPDLSGIKFLLVRDIEPEVITDKDYLLGYGEAVRDFNSKANNGAHGVTFVPSFYMSFTPARARNKTAVDELVADIDALPAAQKFSFQLWAQHPNHVVRDHRVVTSVDEIFEYGMKPYVPNHKAANLWQFDNYDDRFLKQPVGAAKVYWLDHDIATGEAFDLLWKGDEALYKV